LTDLGADVPADRDTNHWRSIMGNWETLGTEQTDGVDRAGMRGFSDVTSTWCPRTGCL
jgi:hypothetical protein